MEDERDAALAKLSRKRKAGRIGQRYIEKCTVGAIRHEPFRRLDTTRERAGDTVIRSYEGYAQSRTFSSMAIDNQDTLLVQLRRMGHGQAPFSGRGQKKPSIRILTEAHESE